MTSPQPIPLKTASRLLASLLPAVLLLGACALTSEGEARTPPGEAPGKAPDDLAALPPDQLPPRTREKPDPSKDRFELAPVYVWVEEIVTPQQGDAYAPDVRVTEGHLKAYLQRAGYPIVTDAKKAAYRIEGSVKLFFHSELRALEQQVGWKYRAEAWFLIFGKSGDQIRRVNIPELFQENVKSDKSAVLHTRRYLAKIAWDNIFLRGEPFARPAIVSLLHALPVDTAVELPREKGRGARKVTAEEVVAGLADLRFEAVPFLLEAMSDERVVTMKSSYPGVEKELTGSPLRVYHLADKALEEIFQKVSRMNLDTSARDRFRIIQGWEYEWGRFCPPCKAFLKEREEALKAARKKKAAEKPSSGP